MSGNSDLLNVARREFLVGAGAVVTTGYLVIGGRSSVVMDSFFSRPTTNHVVTFDVTKGGIACFEDTAVTPDDSIYANIGDVVLFKALTTSKGKRHLAVLFVDQTPFVDKDGDDFWAFHGSGSDETNGIGKDATIRSGLSDGDMFEFTVGIWDENNSSKTKTYTKDPTIVIGKGGNLAGAIAKLTAADGLLMKAETAYLPAGEEIKSIEVQLKALITKLKLSLTKPQGQSK